MSHGARAEFLARAVVNRLEDRGVIEVHDAEAAITIVAKALEQNFAVIDALEAEARQRLGEAAGDQEIEQEIRRTAAERQITL